MVLVSSSAANAAAQYTVTSGVGVGHTPYGVAIDQATRTAYVANANDDTVSVVDLGTNTVTNSINVGGGPEAVAVDQATHTVYVANQRDDTVSVIDASTHAVSAPINVGGSPYGVAVDPGTHEVYVTNFNDNTVSVIDGGTRSVTSTIAVGAGPFGVEVDPGTHAVYVADTNGSSVSLIDGGSHAVTATIPVGGTPLGVSIDPLTHTVYVSNNAGWATVIDGRTNTVSTSVSIGGTPYGIAVDPETQSVYVADYIGRVVKVIDARSNTVTATVTASAGPFGVGIDRHTHHAYVSLISGNVLIGITPTGVSQPIGFTSTPPAQPVIGATYTVTADGGGSGNPVTFSTISSACTVSAGGAVGFAHAGQCVIDADQAGDATFASASSATQTVTVGQSAQAITFPPVPPSAAATGGSYQLNATGGGSTQPVTYSIAPATTNAACSVTGSTLHFDHPGSCAIAADQAGDSDHAAAPTQTQTVSVALLATSTTMVLSSTGVVHGQTVTATATVTGTHAGSVQFTLDGSPVGTPVALAPDGTAASADLTAVGVGGSVPAVGAHPVGAVLSPTDSSTYSGSSATPQTLTISQAATTTSLSVDAGHVTAVVSPTAPGSGVPTGTVEFLVDGSSIGTASLVGGTATLAHSAPTGSHPNVSVIYSGDASFTGSSVSTARRDPVITATVSSAKAPRGGWYAGPVTVNFVCAPTSAALTTACPPPVTLSRSAGGQSLTRTIVATDGGTATARVGGINIDTAAPVVRITRVRAGATYFARGPVAGCHATDGLSGVAGCAVTRTTNGHRVSYRAVATDRAGNRSSTRLRARTTAVALSGAAMNGGHYVVHRGRSYTVLVASTTRPTYLFAAPSPRRPAGGGIPFKRFGKDRWALGVTFKQSMSRHTWWNLGTRVGRHTEVTTVRVVR